MECFASPLNSYYDKFCSAFPDTDMKFGSIGSFFKFIPDSGCFEVNPPFCEVVMQKMAEHIEYVLSKTSKPLSFIIIVPKWDDDASPMWVIMKNSKYLTNIIDILPGHKYHDGYSHNINKFWIAKHTTTIICLQTNITNKLPLLSNIINIWK
jgi:phosphorylated CTD-interacting factor 1